MTDLRGGTPFGPGPAAGDRPAPPCPRVVIFDLGEVLATPPGLYQRLAACLPHRPEDVETAYWAHREAYDRGGSATAFWGRLLADLGICARDGLIAELTRIDTEAWTTIRPDATALLEDLSERGVRVGILSNATREMAAAARETPWAPYVSDWFFSAELRLAKPDAAIYRHVTDRLGLPAADVLFVDDRQVNVDAALGTGWSAHRWITGARTEELLRRLGVL
ncbi:HAD family phosphatase [Streptomyces sp. TS71-3]|uniref:HAD family hydrolase n=1 Tax=Streptomyces sp. TS71-3 TaxID=2733862 RepID=UPI001B2B3871|nr:HAD family phosphatase [Streptomyces sp. TS71-3]GHJ41977.1 haloacid dehalogenase [Streptomyces sp. TS71-3]